MKKLYHRKGTVHPSAPLISDHLAFLPATILTLAAALSLEDREVLAYLISCTTTTTNGNHRRIPTTTTNGVGGKGGDHPPSFNCNCFRCYMTYWVRWDSSPNRQLIHEIIDAFEDGLLQNKKDKTKKERRKRGCNGSCHDLTRSDHLVSGKDELGGLESVKKNNIGGDDDDDDDDGEEGFEKGSVRKFVSFLGERIWSVWT